MQLPAGCLTGSEIVGFVNKALEQGRIGGDLVSDGTAYAEAQAAVNNPKTEMGVEIPLWPWSEEPKYCDGSPEKARANAIMGALVATAATNDTKSTEAKEEIKRTVGGWFASLAFWLKVVLGAIVVLLAAYVWRSFRRVAA